MCGIMGAIAKSDVSQSLLDGLYRLEYRGYDSAGLALIDQQGLLKRLRVLGKVSVLAEVMSAHDFMGHLGIAHTRWATHGKPSEENAHPQVSHDRLAVVHNGIIENYESLRQELSGLSYVFTSETDTEVSAHLIHFQMQTEPSLLKAIMNAMDKMQGSFSLGVIDVAFPHELFAARKGSPLILAKGGEGSYMASDLLALREVAESYVFLEEGDCARLSLDGIEIFDRLQQKTERSWRLFEQNEEPLSFGKGIYRHFMLKEIFEQAKAIADTTKGRIHSMASLRESFSGAEAAWFDEIKAIHIVACGTSHHAALIAKYWLESIAKIPTQIDIASEYRYRDVVVLDQTLFISVSQSGETADTLAALYKAKTLPYLSSLAICNVSTSSLVRESEHVFLTRAGIEISVASTKAFTTQLAAFLMLATALCKDERAQELLLQLAQLPHYCEQVFLMDHQIEKLAAFFVNKEHALFLGRGLQYPVALEGALKLKELSYIHAEAYPAGELKHGPLALVDDQMPVVVIAPNDELLDKLKSNLQEVSARGGQLIVFVADSESWSTSGAQLIRVPHCPSWIAPIVYTIPLQLLAYYVAVAKGTDIDQPRNLAKSVTVE